MAHHPQGWHPEDIKAELRKRFGSLRDLCRSWGLNDHAISNVLRDPSHSVPTEMRIALALGEKPQVLWPDRWDVATGEQLPRPSKADRRPRPASAQRQKRRAA